ncbi:MAG: hypothetical protein JWL90_1755 [Chthoniobacteraceae bacterium]|nr:hypothetical protein [Chthoniobacteraceae bacterium]
MNSKAICVLVAIVAAVAGGGAWLRSGHGFVAEPPASSASHPGTPDRANSFESISLSDAITQGKVNASFSGNGREQLVAILTNNGPAPLQVRIDVGQMFVAVKNAVIITVEDAAEVHPGQTLQRELHTVAIRSSNKIYQGVYSISPNTVPQLDALLVYGRKHSEFSASAMQTAVLVLMENLPLSAVAKFTSATGELKSRFNTDSFRVECGDILSALAALREIGVPDASLTMTIDPQLKIEAMIDPLSRPQAMRYYGISARNEWEFWRAELLSGPPATRHYALYGIARFYPEIAIEMLPKWARESQTSAVYRLAAVQALAETQRADALRLLRELSEDLGSETELGRAASGAADSLQQRLEQARERQTAGASSPAKEETPSRF